MIYFIVNDIFYIIPAGIIAPTVGITEPTVHPLPTWASGITATCGLTIGSDAAATNCFSASGSTYTPIVCLNRMEMKEEWRKKRMKE